MSDLNKVLLAVMIGLGGYNLWTGQKQKLFPLQPLYQKPYIVLYGRDTCGNCQALRRDLEERKVPYVWKIIDEDPGRSEAIERMKQAGLDVGSFMLPVVDVNAEMMTHPETADVI